MKVFLKRLSEAHGVPGGEEEVREIIKGELPKNCETRIDRLGNLIAKKGGGKLKVMLAAHMDEVGLMVKYVDKEGFLRFTTLGGFSDQSLLNQRVVVHGKRRAVGVIGSKPPHLLKPKEKDKVIEHRDMFIDVGAKDRKGVERLGIEVGDIITYDRAFAELGGDLVTGKAFDNRLGCVAMVEVMKRVRSPHTIYAVGTAQEEVGLKGARTSAFAIEPDIAIVLDATVAGGYPGIKEEEATTKLGGGPAITIADAQGRGLISQPAVRDLLIQTAKRNKIPYQVEVGEGGTTDATAIQLTRGGVASGVVSVPVRYLHSPVEVASLKDLENTVKLVTKVLEGSIKL